MQASNHYSAKAGRFTYDLPTKKVRVCKDKGQLKVYTNEEGENIVSWINHETKMEEISIIVFPFDAIFEKVSNQNNTFVLKFQSNDDRYFFYLQEKINTEDFVKIVNERISFTPPEPMDSEVADAPVEKKEEPMQIQHPKPQIVNQGKVSSTLDFIKKMQSNLMAAKKKEAGITHLSKVLTPEVINALLTETSAEQKQEFVEYLPQQQKDASHIASNIRSPQFQQAVDVLSDALNSENIIPLFMELGLDQKFLQKSYGVHAFLRALEQWASRQKKQ